MELKLKQTLLDISEKLQNQGHRYAVIGGVATTILGYLRVTQDVDLVVDSDVPTALRIYSELVNNGYRAPFDNIENVIRNSRILPLENIETGVKVDMAIGESGFEKQVIARSASRKIGKSLISTATAEDIVLMKPMAARDQDVIDVKELVKVHRSNLDWSYCLDTARQLDEALATDLVTSVGRLRG